MNTDDETSDDTTAGHTTSDDTSTGDEQHELDADSTYDESAVELTPAHERRTVSAGAFVLAVMVAMALAVLAVVGFTMDSGGRTGDQASDQDIRLAAGRFAERFLTFDHDHIDEWKQEVLALSTGGFAKEVADVESGLRRLIADNALDANTQVTDIFVGQPERGAVEVVVIYDRDLSGTAGTRSEDNRYMQLSMVRVDGQWLVDNVIDVASAGDALLPGAGAPDSGSASSTTTTSTTEAGPAG